MNNYIKETKSQNNKSIIVIDMHIFFNKSIIYRRKDEQDVFDGFLNRLKTYRELYSKKFYVEIKYGEPMKTFEFHFDEIYKETVLEFLDYARKDYLSWCS